MRRTTALLALLALGGTTACADPHSFELRWSIEDRGEPSVPACADSGLFQVRARVYTAPGILADEFAYPCFPDAFEGGGLVPGPTLPPGSYAIELRGLDRADVPWDDPLIVDPDQPEHNGCNPMDDYTECRPNERVCDCLRLVVDAEGSSTPPDSVTVVTSEGETALTPLEFTLDPPTECEDGIDNDLDGRVDEGDPSCVVDFADGTEGIPVGITDFELTVTLLGQNPVALCSSVPQFRRVQLRLEREGVEPAVLLDEPCQLGSPYRFSALLPPGLATFSIVGIDDRGGEETIATTARAFEQELTELGNLVRQSVDFAPADFLEPIEGRMLVSFSYGVSLGTEQGDSVEDRVPVPPRTSCNPVPGEGRLAIDGLRLTMLNAHGGPLATPVRLDDGTVLDGSTVLPCGGGTIITESVEWTEGYSLTVEALSAEGDVCFQAKDLPMRPGEALASVLPRVFHDNGTIVASCLDCRIDEDGLDTFGDCSTDSFSEARCIDRICQYPCLVDGHCGLDEYDGAFSCVSPDPDDPTQASYCEWTGSSG